MEFSVRTSELKKSALALQETQAKLKSVAATVSSVARSLDTNMEAYQVVATRLDKFSSNLSKAQKKTVQMKSRLTEVATLYQKTENQVVGAASSPQKNSHKGSNSGNNSAANWKSQKPKGVKQSDWDKFVDKVYASAGKENADKILKTLITIGSLKGLDLTRIKIETLYADSKSKKDGGSAEAGVLRITIPGKKGLYHSEAVVDIGRADAGATGDASFKEGLKGDASSEATAVRMRYSEILGNKKYNVRSDTEIEIGNVEASIKGHADKDGLGLSIGARADAASVSRGLGLTVGGAALKGKLGASAGASANAAFEVGPKGVKADAGIGLGAGVKAGVELDMEEYNNSRHAATKEASEARRAAEKYTAGGGGFSSGGGGRGAFGSGNGR